jgi:hypothetical protein
VLSGLFYCVIVSVLTFDKYHQCGKYLCNNVRIRALTHTLKHLTAFYGSLVHTSNIEFRVHI